jgi:hypothetical protein
MRNGIDTTSIKPRPKAPPKPPPSVAYWSLEIEAEQERRRKFRELHQSVLSDILAGKRVGSYY